MTQVYEILLEENKVLRYNSKIDFNNFWIDKANIQDLTGCFVIDQTLGQLSLSSFSLNIKSLLSPFSYQAHFTLNEWKQICGYMKKVIYDNPQNPH